MTTATLSMLDRLAVSTAKPKSGTTPIVIDLALAKPIEALSTAIILLKYAEARNARLTDEPMPMAEAHLLALSRHSGKLVSTIKLGQLMYCTQNKYSAINPDEAPSLSQQFGEDFGQYFRREYSLEIDAARLP